MSELRRMELKVQERCEAKIDTHDTRRTVVRWTVDANLVRSDRIHDVTSAPRT